MTSINHISRKVNIALRLIENVVKSQLLLTIKPKTDTLSQPHYIEVKDEYRFSDSENLKALSEDESNHDWSEQQNSNDSDLDFECNFKTSAKESRAKETSTKSVFIDAPISFDCSKCKLSFDSFLSLVAHMRARSCIKEVISCKFCNKRFKTKKTLSGHMNTHKPKEKVICDMCGEDFTNQVLL